MVRERVNQPERDITRCHHLATAAEVPHVEQQIARAVQTTCVGLCQRVPLNGEGGCPQHGSAVAERPVIHQQVRALKRAAVIKRCAFQFSTAGGQHAPAVDGVHHIQQQRDGLHQSAAVVRQFRGGQREFTAGEDFAVVLQAGGGLNGRLTAALYCALVVQRRC